MNNDLKTRSAPSSNPWTNYILLNASVITRYPDIITKTKLSFAHAHFCKILFNCYVNKVVSLSAMLLVTQLLELSLEEVVGKLNNINSNQLLHSNINNNLSMDSLKNHKELVLGKSRVLFNVPSNNLIFHSVRDSMRLLDNAKRRMDSKEIFSLDTRLERYLFTIM